jgi:hypothetical protein
VPPIDVKALMSPAALARYDGRRRQIYERRAQGYAI